MIFPILVTINASKVLLCKFEKWWKVWTIIHSWNHVERNNLLEWSAIQFSFVPYADIRCSTKLKIKWEKMSQTFLIGFGKQKSFYNYLGSKNHPDCLNWVYQHFAEYIKITKQPLHSIAHFSLFSWIDHFTPFPI